MDSILHIQHLFFAYQEAFILKDVSLNIKEGEYIGIIGPNGGGKTTLLKLIMGFLKPHSGEIKVFGLSPHSGSHSISYVPQTLRYDRQFPISVLELVLSGRLSCLPWYGRYSQKDREAAFKALEKVGLLDYQDQAFGTLSGGQTQRALIARALVSNPKLLLLDEPTASVDAQAESDIYNILKSLRGQMTILMVTHDLRAVVDQVDRVICVQGGAFSLSPQEICEHFALGLYHPPLITVGQKP